MIIYNTTFSVPKELKNDFLNFIREEYVPEALKSKHIKDPRLSRVYSSSEESSFSYALEFKAETVDDLEKWNFITGKRLYFRLMKKFKQNVLGFSTVLKPLSI